VYVDNPNIILFLNDKQLADIILTEFNTTQVKIRVSKPAAVPQAKTSQASPRALK
jgi:hypothetical protein